MKKQQELRVEELCWSPGKNQHPVLQDVTVTLKKGCFYGILGPNGSGKTSFIRHLLRILSVEKDVITLEGSELNSYSRKELAKRISFVPQNTNIDAAFSVYDIVAMGRTPYLKKFAPFTKRDTEIIEEALDITDCARLKDKSFSHLSGGEKQRVLVARAIAQDTPWVILDEPISSLDIKHQIDVMETLKRRNKDSGCTVIAILHDINLAAAYCNEIILMRQGELFAAGETEEVLTKENLKAVYEMDFEILWNEQNNRPYFVPKI